MRAWSRVCITYEDIQSSNELKLHLRCPKVPLWAQRLTESPLPSTLFLPAVRPCDAQSIIFKLDGAVLVFAGASFSLWQALE